jgi:hypothetical protein
MHTRLLIPAMLLAAVAAALIRGLVTRHGVGPGEYAVGGLLAATLLFGALRLSRDALR